MRCQLAPAALCPDFPGFTGLQAFGLGIPSTLVQGIGNPKDSFSNKPLGVFWQDSFRVRSNLTFNLGVRYDIEFPPQLAPAERVWPSRLTTSWACRRASTPTKTIFSRASASRGIREATAKACFARRMESFTITRCLACISSATPPTARRAASCCSRAAAPAIPASRRARAA